MKRLFMFIGVVLLIAAILFNTGETIYYGMNKTAMSRGEEIADVISSLMYNSGLTSLIISFFIKLTFEKED